MTHRRIGQRTRREEAGATVLQLLPCVLETILEGANEKLTKLFLLFFVQFIRRVPADARRKKANALMTPPPCLPPIGGQHVGPERDLHRGVHERRDPRRKGAAAACVDRQCARPRRR